MFNYLYLTHEIISTRVIDTHSFELKTLRPHPCFCVVTFLSVVDHKRIDPRKLGYGNVKYVERMRADSRVNLDSSKSN